jgi:hypothetical protein
VLLGGAAKVEVPVAPSFFVTGSAGYTNLSCKSEFKDALEAFGADSPSAGFIPVKVGGKYFFGKNFYGAGELGAAFGTGDAEGTAFVWAPGVGASFPVSAKKMTLILVFVTRAGKMKDQFLKLASMLLSNSNLDKKIAISLT